MNKLYKLVLTLLIVSFTVTLVPITRAESSLDSMIVANAGEDRFVKAGTEIFFDGSLSNIPEGIEPIYRWDMGDNVLRYGLRHVYSYNQVGTYRVRLVVEGKNTELKSTDETIIHVFDKNMVVVSSASDSSMATIKKITSLAILKNYAVLSSRIEDFFPSDIALKSSLVDELISKQSEIKEATVIVLVGDISLESFLSFSKKLNINSEKLKVLYVMPDTVILQPRYNLAKIFQKTLNISDMMIVSIENIDENFLDFKNGSENGILLTLEDGRMNYRYLDYLFRFNESLIERGFSIDVIYFLYIMILVSILGLFLRKILGLSVIGMHVLGLSIFSTLIIGLVPSIGLFIGFFVVSYLVSKVYDTDRETMFSGSFIDMLMLIFFIIIGMILIQSYNPGIIFDVGYFTAILILAIAARRIAQYTIGMNISRTIFYLLQDILFLIFNYFLLNSSLVRLYIISYPELYVVIIVIIAFLLERYTGLRVSEFVRFKNLIKHEYYLKETQE